MGRILLYTAVGKKESQMIVTDGDELSRGRYR